MAAEFWNLSTLSDNQLLQDLSELLAGSARVEARIVAHLTEVEERRLHLKAACSSLFDYCLRRIGLSESEAFHRITAARLARRFPVIFELLEGRAIHLSALRILRDHLTTENHRELLTLARKSSCSSPPSPRGRMSLHESENCQRRDAVRACRAVLRLTQLTSQGGWPPCLLVRRGLQP